MTWTSEKPTVPGYYFYRRDNAVHLFPVSVINRTIGVMCPTSINPYTSMGNYSHVNLNQFPGEWAGPVEVPS